MKICSQCRAQKEPIDFYSNAGKFDGLQNMCKLCSKKNDKKRVISGANKKRCSLYYNRKRVDPDFMRKHNTYQSLRKRTDAFRNKQRQKYANNLQERLSQTIRTRIRAALLTGGPKADRTLKLLGCNIDQLKDWLGKKFLKGMSWNNYGEWHIDHIKPCIAFDLTNTEEQKHCFHFSNLQPLWAKDNLKKSNGLPPKE